MRSWGSCRLRPEVVATGLRKFLRSFLPPTPCMRIHLFPKYRYTRRFVGRFWAGVSFYFSHRVPRPCLCSLFFGIAGSRRNASWGRACFSIRYMYYGRRKYASYGRRPVPGGRRPSDGPLPSVAEDPCVGCVCKHHPPKPSEIIPVMGPKRWDFLGLLNDQKSVSCTASNAGTTQHYGGGLRVEIPYPIWNLTMYSTNC